MSGPKRAAPPRTYRIVCYDAANRLVTADLIEAATDQDAIAMVEGAGFGTKCEIWHGGRLVAHLEAERQQA
jgi:hypothetical protein